MALSQFLLSVTMLVVGTPPLHHHFPQSGSVCAEHRFGFARSGEASTGSGIDESWTLDAMAIGFADVLIQHEAPTVVLREAGPSSLDLGRQLFSSDEPSFWSPVRYGPLTVEVRLVTTTEMVESLEHVVLLLDNRPLEPLRPALLAEPPRMLENGLLQVVYRYSLPCPPPGKHILQARYKLAGVWSRLSMPLHFDVRLPDPPQIIAISDGDGHPVPIHSGQMLSITSPSLKLQLAQVECDATVVAYLNGKSIKAGKHYLCCCQTGPSQSQALALPSNMAHACCCRIVKLEGHITPGVHRLTVRTVHEQSNHFIASEFSNEVVFHYYDEDVYLLRPGRHSGNRCCPCRHPAACMAPETSSSSHSRHSRHSRPESLPPQPALPPALEGSHLSVAEQSERTVEPRVSFVALQQGGYLEAARIMLAHTKEFRDSAATAADAAARPAAEAMGQLRLATLELAKVTEQQGQEQQRQADKSREAVQARATDAVRAREAAIAARTAADLALGQARICAKEIEQHVTNGNAAAAEAARVHLEAAHAAAGAAANEALKQRDLAAQHARSAAAHLSELTALVRQEKERIQETQPSIEQMEMIGKLGKSVAVLIRQAVDSINEVCDDKLAAIQFAEDLEELAEREEAKADAWIRVVQAESRIERAAAITGPPSPFYFAAPAHFPIRGFGAGGEVIERPGAVIYEDMVFSFDRDGNYHLRFSILIPDLPTTLHLQLQLQPDSHDPWYTITLPPQQFRPEESRYGRPQPRVIQDHVIRGRSEILHRCYGEMGENATIRRTGSARFGYGFDAMRQATAH